MKGSEEFQGDGLWDRSWMIDFCKVCVLEVEAGGRGFKETTRWSEWHKHRQGGWTKGEHVVLKNWKVDLGYKKEEDKFENSTKFGHGKKIRSQVLLGDSP